MKAKFPVSSFQFQSRFQPRLCGMNYLLPIVFLAYAVGVTGVGAQVRRSAGTGARKASPRANVVIKKIEAVGASCRVRTPEYSTTVAEARSATRRWGRVSVRYDTRDEWTDDLEFRYYVLVQQAKTRTYLLFTGTVTYIDIARGRHVSTVFLRPNTIERYGPMQRVAVEIYSKGEQVAVASDPARKQDKQPWWHVISGQVKAVEGVLLNRAQTPFALVACDNYETIKAE